MNNSLAKRGFGHFLRPCITELPLRLSRVTEKALLTYLRSVGSAGNSVLERLREKGLIPGKFNGGGFLFSQFQYMDDLAQCTLHHLTAFNVNSTWALSADITNAPVTTEKPDRLRLYLAENVYVDAGKRVRALPMTIHENVGTTSLSKWGGAPATSRFFTRLPAKSNPAVLAGLRMRNEEREQAEDALQGSNVAILSLPLVSALLPIALFADVGRFAAIAYLLLTDVATMLPLAIKGIELIAFSQRKLDATRLRIYDVLDTKKIGAAELWHAKCTTQNHLLLKGTAFLCVSLVLMVVGVVLEIVARGFLSRKKEEFEYENARSSVMQMWERSARNVHCGYCACEEAGGLIRTSRAKTLSIDGAIRKPFLARWIIPFSANEVAKHKIF